jgi:hypothetical protein
MAELGALGVLDDRGVIPGTDLQQGGANGVID